MSYTPEQQEHLMRICSSQTRLNIEEVVDVFPYGSRVYSTARKQSDYDYIVTIKNKANEQFSNSLININFYTPNEHQKRLNDHEISALECHFLPDNLRIKHSGLYGFKLDLVKLRHSLSAKSSNSWAKAHKKLTVEKDFDLDLGRKSLFHSFRIIDFGIQIATHGKIVDYGSCNDLFKEIMNHYTWNSMFEEYKKRYNELCSEFRIVAPK